MAKKMNKEIINLAYIKDRQYSIIEAVERNNIEPFKAFYRKWLQHRGSLPDTSDLTFTIAARKICVQLETIPAKTKEKAKKCKCCQYTQKNSFKYTKKYFIYY